MTCSRDIQQSKSNSTDCHVTHHRLVGLMVKVSASPAADLGFNSCLCLGEFFVLSNSSDFTTGTPVATLPGA